MNVSLIFSQIEDEGVCAEDLDRSRELPQEDRETDGIADIEEDEEEAEMKRIQAAARAETYNKPYRSFFSLLKALIVEEQEEKTSTMKVGYDLYSD